MRKLPKISIIALVAIGLLPIAAALTYCVVARALHNTRVPDLTPLKGLSLGGVTSTPGNIAKGIDMAGRVDNEYDPAPAIIRNLQGHARQ